jgi:hypothetical protein
MGFDGGTHDRTLVVLGVHCLTPAGWFRPAGSGYPAAGSGDGPCSSSKRGRAENDAGSDVTGSPGDEAAAVAATLAPYAWREFTDRMLARRAVAAVDRHDVLRFLARIPGAAAGDAPPVEVADACDERVDALVLVLQGQLWRGWSLARVCAELTNGLDDWHVERENLESDLRRLLEGQ